MTNASIATRLLVTGAGGFVGRWLQRELEVRSAESPIDVWKPAEGARQLDVTDAQQVNEIVRSYQPDAVVHLAAIAAPGLAREAPSRAWNVNVIGTVNLVYAIMKHVPDARFVYVGSSEVYGAAFAECAGVPITETAALRPTSPYGATKAAADLFVGQMVHDGLDAIRFRPFNHTGPGQADIYVVSSFARQVADIMLSNHRPHMNVGNLSVQRDFIDVRDVVRAYADAALLPRGAHAGRVFNLASGEPRSIRSILDRLIEFANFEIEVNIDPSRMRYNEMPFVAGDVSAVGAALGWQPRIPFEATLRNILSYWLERLSAAAEPNIKLGH